MTKSDGTTKGPKDKPTRPALTDLGNAVRLVRLFQGSLLYSPTLRSFQFFDQTHWRALAPEEADRLANRTALSLKQELARLKGDARKTLEKFALKSQSEPRLRAMLNRAKSLVPHRAPNDFDRAPWLLNFQNGTLDLRTGELRQHDANDFLTRCLLQPYDRDGQCPLWRKFQLEIANGDAELASFKQRLFGSALAGTLKEKRCIFFNVGTGNNGKTTELTVLRDALGEYGGQLRIEVLTEARFRDGNAPSPEITDLRGKRFVVCSEPEEGQRVSAALLKYLTSSGRIKSRRLFENNIEFEQSWKLFIDCNHLPEIRDSSNAVWNRILVVPYDATIPDSAIDPELPVKLRGELTGILAWLVEGCLQWQEIGLCPPSVVLDRTEDQRGGSDPIARFFSEACEPEPMGSVRARELFQAFINWSLFHGNENVHIDDVTEAAFGREAVKRFKRERDANGLFYRGIRLIPDD